MVAEQLRYWESRLYSDEYYQAIIGSRAFKRLEDISFLGALDYTSMKSAYSGSRAQHSVAVAALTMYVTCKWNLNEDHQRTLVTAALLHDVGHAPLSHSVESLFKEQLGFGHHLFGNQIILGEAPIGRSLSNILRNSVDIDQVIATLDGHSEDDFAARLFQSPINVDTIEGICRSHAAASKTSIDAKLDRLLLAKNAFLMNDEADVNVLDEFWTLKHRVYGSVINSPKGILADKVSQLFFLLNEKDYNWEHQFSSSDSNWKRIFPSLFNRLLAVGTTQVDAYSWIEPSHTEVAFRKYKVNGKRSDWSRYQSKKEKKTVSLEQLIKKVTAWKQNSTVSLVK